MEGEGFDGVASSTDLSTLANLIFFFQYDLYGCKDETGCCSNAVKYRMHQMD
jgi:hypothetical protein